MTEQDYSPQSDEEVAHLLQAYLGTLLDRGLVRKVVTPEGTRYGITETGSVFLKQHQSPSSDQAVLSSVIGLMAKDQVAVIEHVSAVLKDEVTVILPVLNEEEAIGSVLDELKDAGFAKILVVDGYSTDSTVKIALARGVKVVSQHGSGKGGAVKTGIGLVETPYLVVMDGDHTYDPKDIDRLLLHGDRHDLVIGARASNRNIRLLHRLGNRIISFAFDILIGKSVIDVCSGMYLLKTGAARSLQLDSRSFDIEAEVSAQCQSNGTVTEVPITYRKRIGKPKLSAWTAGLRIFRSIVALSWAYNPVFLLSSIASLLALPGAALLLWELTMRYMYGATVWSEGIAWLGLTMLLVGANAFTLAMVSLLMRRIERRIISHLDSLSESQMTPSTGKDPAR